MLHGVLVDLGQHLHGRVGQAALGVAGSGRGIVEGSEVAMGVDQGDGPGELLGQPHEGVVDGGIAVGVVLAHGVAHHPGALAMRPVGADSHVEHGVEDAALHRFQAVAGIGDGPGGDDRQGVGQKRL